jgi:hypothetical protein
VEVIVLGRRFFGPGIGVRFTSGAKLFRMTLATIGVGTHLLATEIGMECSMLNAGSKCIDGSSWRRVAASPLSREL